MSSVKGQIDVAKYVGNRGWLYMDIIWSYSLKFLQNFSKLNYNNAHDL